VSLAIGYLQMDLLAGKCLIFRFISDDLVFGPSCNIYHVPFAVLTIQIIYLLTYFSLLLIHRVSEIAESIIWLAVDCDV